MARTSRLAAISTLAVLALTVAGCGSGSSTTSGANGSSSSSAAGGSSTAPAGDGSSTAPAAGGNDNKQIIQIVKLAGGGWFNRMKTGNDEWAKANGFTVTQTSGDDASPEKQIAVISDTIPKKPAAIAVVPNSPDSLEAVLKRAQGAGIVVVTHEAAGIKNTNADIEAFDNASYGAHQMDLLAKCIGSAGGQYAHFVGALTVASHMAWVKAAAQEAKDKYPAITSIGDPIPSNESEDTAYQQTKQLLAKYPNLKGILGAASTDVAGAGRAIKEAGKTNQVCVIGTSIPSVVGDLLTSGDIDAITFWDPALAGKAMLTIAKTLAGGGKIGAGTDLGIPGYSSLKVDPASATTYFGNAWVDVTKDNAKDYPF